LAEPVEILGDLERALVKLRAAHGTGGWRDAVVESSAQLSHSIAGLLETLATPPADYSEKGLRAQRYARVKVAEMRLYAAERVTAGQNTRDLYSALRTQIDEARAAFAGQFLTPPNGVPDYLHEELVRALAQNDEALLGPHYPGPLA
jgi:hypothetical protein